jgi:hypothetical protein
MVVRPISAYFERRNLRLEPGWQGIYKLEEQCQLDTRFPPP